MTTRLTALNRDRFTSNRPFASTRETRRWLKAPGVKDPADVAFAVTVLERADAASRNLLTLLFALAALSLAMAAVVVTQELWGMVAYCFYLSSAIMLAALVVLITAAFRSKPLHRLYSLRFPPTPPVVPPKPRSRRDRIRSLFRP